MYTDLETLKRVGVALQAFYLAAVFGSVYINIVNIQRIAALLRLAFPSKLHSE